MAKNKTRQFEIPKDIIGIFFPALEEADLTYSLMGINEDDQELIIEVRYSLDERDEVMNMIELLDEYHEENSEEEEEED